MTERCTGQLRRITESEAQCDDLRLADLPGFVIRTLRVTGGTRLRVYHGERLCGEAVLVNDVSVEPGQAWYAGEVPIDGCSWFVRINRMTGEISVSAPRRPWSDQRRFATVDQDGMVR